MDSKTKDLKMEMMKRRDSDASSSVSDDMDPLAPPQSISNRRRSSLIEQFREFLTRSVDFSFKIDDPFEKEMY